MTREDALLRRARFYGSTELHDVLMQDGRVKSVVPSGKLDRTMRGIEPADLDGRFVGPGLWDAHVHFTQWVKSRDRLDLSSATSAGETTGLVRRSIDSGEVVGRILEGYGFRDGLWSDTPTIEALDAASGEMPVVLVSGDLHCAWLNSLAREMLGVEGEAALLRETEWFRVQPQLEALRGPVSMAAFRSAARSAAERGVVGIVDFESGGTIDDWPARVGAGVDQLRVDAAVWPWQLDEAILRGFSTGAVREGTAGLIRVGPLKVVLDGSLNTRTAYCNDPYPDNLDGVNSCGQLSVDEFELHRLLRLSSSHGIGAAIHAIGDRANAIVLDAFQQLGIRDATIEHAQLVADDDFARFAELGVTASVQPEHAMDDRDVAEHHWAGRTDRSFAYGSLLRAGARLALGSDAPVAPLDPWIGIAAAVSRSRDGRSPWHPEQSIDIRDALTASSRIERGLRVGDAADLVITDQDPLTAPISTLRNMPVWGTMLGGRWTWKAEG